MPIHDQGYRRYGGTRLPPGGRWRVIARAGVMGRLRERRFLALLLLAWSPFIVRAVQTYISARFPQARFLAPTADTFREFLDQQSLFVFFVTIYAGAGLIADDRRANALQLYLSKPLSRLEYVGGKLLVLVVFLTAVTWLPAMLLLALQVMFTGSAAFVRDNLRLVPAITGFCVLLVGTSSLVMVALSSMSSSRRFVAVLYAGLVFFSAAVYQVLGGLTGSTLWAWMSPEAVFDVIADGMFGLPQDGALPLAAALVAVAALASTSILVLDRRVRAVDVVT
jgi:ABC-2 type transport system permease protein